MIICVGWIPDCHIPFHDPKALGAVLNCLADSRLHGLYLGGDIFDMYWANQHGPKDPRIFSTLESEKEAVNKFLDQVDLTWPTQKKRFIEGNHETRFERYLIAKCPELFGVTSIELLIRMNERPNWSYHPFGNQQLVQIAGTSLHTKHAPKGSSGGAIMNANACDLIFGHLHRRIYEARTTGDGRVVRICCPGWLGQGASPVFSYVPGHQNWQQGAARIFVDTDTKEHWLDLLEVNHGACVADGRRYTG